MYTYALTCRTKKELQRHRWAEILSFFSCCLLRLRSPFLSLWYWFYQVISISDIFRFEIPNCLTFLLLAHCLNNQSSAKISLWPSRHNTTFIFLQTSTHLQTCLLLTDIRRKKIIMSSKLNYTIQLYELLSIFSKESFEAMKSECYSETVPLRTILI